MSHNHPHEHHHHHHHNHAPTDFGRAFAIGIALNSGFVLAEIICGLKANSLSLLADAGHNASDVLALLLAWGATWLAKRKPSLRYTYGLSGSSILAAFSNAVLLLVVTGGIAWEALLRLADPQPSQGASIIIVAALGIFINGFTAWLFRHGSKGDLNIRAAYLHMAADAAVSLSVVMAGFALMKTGWLWLDPMMSLIISAVIVMGSWGLLKDSMRLALDAAPDHIDTRAVKNFLLQQDGVKEVHDLHIWAISTTQTALSAHLLMQSGHPGDAFLQKINHALAHDFSIQHTTIQIELGDGNHACTLAPDHVV